MREIIATIKLAPGEVGYYDEFSRIHLTLGNQTKSVLAGTNVSQIKRSIKSGRILLLSGSLGEDKKIIFKKDVLPEIVVEKKIEEPVIEEVENEASDEIIEEPIIEATEEVVPEKDVAAVASAKPKRNKEKR